MSHIPVEKITLRKMPIHDALCRCDECAPDAGIWPTPLTGFACLLIALAGIAVNFISFS